MTVLMIQRKLNIDNQVIKHKIYYKNYNKTNNYNYSTRQFKYKIMRHC